MYTDPLGQTAGTEHATSASLLARGQVLLQRCLGDHVTVQVKRLGTELVKTRALAIYALRSPSGRIYVGRTTRDLPVRFTEHRRGSGHPDLRGGFEEIGFFDIIIPELETAAQTAEFIQLIEQLVIESFGGKTQLLNERNEISETRKPIKPGSKGRGVFGFWDAYC